MKHGLLHLVLGVALAVAALPSAWSQAMQIRKATDLRQEPAPDAQVLSPLDINTPVIRLEGRQGAYVQIQTPDNRIGWVRMFDIGPRDTAPSDSGAGAAKDALRGLTGLLGASNRREDNSETATLGIRGLGAQDIANAQPNPGELARAQSQRANADKANAFAVQAGLRSRAVGELPVPPAPTANPQTP